MSGSQEEVVQVAFPNEGTVIQLTQRGREKKKEKTKTLAQMQ